MSKWQAKAEEMKESIQEFNSWLAADYSNWGSLPDGVKNLLSRGLVVYEDLIHEYERFAKEGRE